MFHGAFFNPFIFPWVFFLAVMWNKSWPRGTNGVKCSYLLWRALASDSGMRLTARGWLAAFCCFLFYCDSCAVPDFQFFPASFVPALLSVLFFVDTLRLVFFFFFLKEIAFLFRKSQSCLHSRSDLLIASTPHDNIKDVKSSCTIACSKQWSIEQEQWAFFNI